MWGKIGRSTNGENEEVPLDGFRYQNCTMKNVTFRYDGKTPIQFENNHVHGTYDFVTDNPALSNLFIWLCTSHELAPNAQIVLPPGALVDCPHKEAR